jgi:hypothetical protein
MKGAPDGVATERADGKDGNHVRSGERGVCACGPAERQSSRQPGEGHPRHQKASPIRKR